MDAEGDGIVLVIEFRPAAGRAAELARAVEGNVRRAAARRVGMTSWTLHEEDDGRLVVIAHWESEQALSAHMSSSAAAFSLEQLVGLLAEPLVPRVVERRRAS